jgi:hypothetical protein
VITVEDDVVEIAWIKTEGLSRLSEKGPVTVGRSGVRLGNLDKGYGFTSSILTMMTRIKK